LRVSGVCVLAAGAGQFNDSRPIRRNCFRKNYQMPLKKRAIGTCNALEIFQTASTDIAL
jgi:hypothetical protein